jgi:hypothetical protein
MVLASACALSGHAETYKEKSQRLTASPKELTIPLLMKTVSR